MDYQFLCKKLCQFEAKRYLFLMGIVAMTHLLCQSLLLPYGNALRSLMAETEITSHGKSGSLIFESSAKYATVHNSPYSDASESTVELKGGENSNTWEQIRHVDELKITDRITASDIESEDGDVDIFVDLDEDENTGEDISEFEKTVDLSETSAFDNSRNMENSSVFQMTSKTRHGLSLEQFVKSSDEISTGDNLKSATSSAPNKTGSGSSAFQSSSHIKYPVASAINVTYLESLASNGSASVSQLSLQSDLKMSENNSVLMINPVRKKFRCNMPPKSITSIDEMNRILIRHRRSSRAMRPRWLSARDQEILAVKAQIQNARIVRNDQELHAPLFRNISTFKRSYELMERMLKVYIYKEGQKPIFHQPILKGLYASEGWFMKLMEGNKHFVVKNPRKAHLFYMPFSTRMLEHTLYVRNSHNRTNLRQYLKEYSEQIAARYSFWNRTGGSDHFLVACHDWAPYETRHHMEHCIKALCNADVTVGFKIGRDVSFPETYVRSARNPLRDLGGKPAPERHILAFYAGSLHGYLRPILLNYWKDKDTDMKIFGRMPLGVASKMNYIQHMKTSKYCICPKGYEVNSPRVVEAIFYECVPVIISDNFVPPFFEVLNWDAFAVILAEKDIPNLKDILLSIPEEKYLEMQLAVRKVQQHFLWHAKPVKYDLFHMTLHSIWYNRVFQIKAR